MFVVHVKSLSDALTVADIRNSGREFMTRYQGEISVEQQVHWWETLDHARHKLYLFYTDDGVLIGFGMLKLDPDNFQWATLALYPEFRGFGYGTKIYAYLTTQVYTDLWIEVLSSNKASFYAAIRAGFVEQWENAGVITLAWRKQ